MTAKEFRELGYLQEVNRTFLHPLGLALSVNVNDDGTEVLGEILDNRNDPEGLYYGIADSDDWRVKEFNRKCEFIDGEFEKREEPRKKSLGFIIEPIPEKGK